MASFIDAKNKLGDWTNRFKKSLKHVSKKIGLGDKIRKAQKREFKKLHQKTWAEMLKSSRRDVVVGFLRDSANAISAMSINANNNNNHIENNVENKNVNDDETSNQSGLVVVEVDVNKQDKWNADSSRVNTGLFLENIRTVVAESLMKWDVQNTKQCKKSIFIRNGRPIYLFQMPFFNDLIRQDGDTISWKEFKVNVFYHYLKNMETNITKINAEIRAFEIIDSTFKQLSSETIKKIGDEDILRFTFGALKSRLEKFSTFEVKEEFWKQECWEDKNSDLKISFNEFIDRYMKGKDLDSLKSILHECEEEHRISVNDNTLSLTAGVIDKDGNKSGKSNKTGKSNKSKISNKEAKKNNDASESNKSGRYEYENDSEFASDSEFESDSENDDSDNNKSSKSAKSSRSSRSNTSNRSSQTKSDKFENDVVAEAEYIERQKIESAAKAKLFHTQVHQLKGAPKDLSTMYPKSNHSMRIVLRKIVSVGNVHANSKSLSKLQVAEELFLNAQTLINKLKSEIQIAIEGEIRKFKVLSKKHRKSNQRLKTITDEHEKKQILLMTKFEGFSSESVKLLKILRHNFRQLLKAQVQISPAQDNVTNDVNDSKRSSRLLQTINDFNTQISGLNKTYVSKNRAVDLLNLPNRIDHSNQFHQPIYGDDNLGYLNAIIAIKEWQMYNSKQHKKDIEKDDRLSLPFLKALLSDYAGHGDKKTDLNFIDALDLVKNYGLITIKEFTNYLNRGDRHSSKVHAQILTQAVKISDDDHLRIKSQDDFMIALSKYGPLAITLPVYTLTSGPNFWKQTTTDITGLLGYHTVVAVGYDRQNKQIKIMNNSWGLNYGDFGFTTVPFNDLFNNDIKRSNVDIIVLVD